LKNIVIDFHVHVFEFETLTTNVVDLISRAYPNRNEYDALSKKYANPHAFLELMEQNGVDYSVILAEISPLSTGIAKNETVEAFCRVSPRLIPFCSINPYLHPNMGEMLEDLCLNHGFKGLKLLPPYNYFYPNDKFLYPLPFVCCSRKTWYTCEFSYGLFNFC